MVDGDKSAGLIDLDPVRGFVHGYGWISLLYLKEEYRRRGCGIQLLGRALIYYQAKGRKALRLCVAEENKEALSFYEKWGFEVIASSQSSTGTLFEMEKKIREKRILA
jgi:probable phosphoglycerate mutase